MRRHCTDVEWFEDYRVGDEFPGEPVLLSSREILDFAGAYDAQSFHVDPDAAKASPYVDIRWLKPVRAGDTLAMVSRVVETKPSQSRPDRGFVSFEASVTNQHGDEVMTLSFKEMIRTRPQRGS